MKAVFDASAILNIFRNGNKEILIGGIIPYLAFYEIGNALWKDVYLLKTMTKEEAIIVWTRIFKYCKEKCKIVGKINVVDTLDIAVKHGITFYDAVYVYLAKKYGVPLVTADKKLIEKIKGFVHTWHVKEII